MMNRARYEELLADRKVIKANGELDFQCTTLCRKFKIGVYLNPSELRIRGTKLMLNQPFLGVFPSNPASILFIPILEEEIIFLMFSEFPEKAFTYRLTMNCTTGEAFLKVLDMPKHANPIITEREISGISKAILPEHKKYTGMSDLG